eukprot:scaffold314917_cov18-Prasinocladus_malaysianus.AAC.1
MNSARFFLSGCCGTPVFRSWNPCSWPFGSGTNDQQYVYINDNFKYVGGLRLPSSWGMPDQIVHGPLLFYSDNCCQEAGVLSRVWPHLAWRMRAAPRAAEEAASDALPDADAEAVDVAEAEATGLHAEDSGGGSGASSTREKAIPCLKVANAVLVDTEAKLVSAVSDLQQCSTVLGLDIEWKVSYEKGTPQRRTSTLQLAKPHLAYVFHLPLCGKQWKDGRLHPMLTQLLADATVKKVGVNIRGDSAKLKRDFGVGIAGALELGPLADMAFPDHCQGRWTLQKLTAWVLRQRLSKDVRVRFSDWEAPTLSAEQIQYAAADAMAGLLAYNALTDSEVQLEPPPADMIDSLLDKSDVDPCVRDFLSAWHQGGDTDKAAEEIAKFPHIYTALIKLDPFHLLQRYGRCLNSKSDPLFGVFMSMMRDALFVTNKEDEDLVKAYLSARGCSEADLKKIPRAYFLQRCRRSIPPPPILAARLQNVYDLFKDAVMANGKYLYRQKTYRTQKSMEDMHLSVLGHVLRGCVSDPPDIP